MKEFAVYTLMRVVLFLGALGITVGIWAAFADGSVQMIWAVVIAFLISGAASLFLLNPQRERFARVVQTRAEKASKKFDEARAREDDQ
ncbi:DUF4229 domain-containing protein [Nocardioides sp. JQ2195]|uniref:DUF4229 domain-containing protein n=1 Tax=Nocardioides sp. JQ2195 TaxID=2592334 RepID=UPI00143EC671|nr:DUF4229 domain-containing protein [Nocardioides sp. JQ2195]QIX28143.1 DUF4229 domain-containing protein [Nocardioides sp. JQ2195]